VTVTTDFLGLQLTLVGAGKIGEAVLRGVFDAGLLSADQVTATVRSESSQERVTKSLGIRTLRSNSEAARGADIVLLAVKPQVVPLVLADLRGIVDEQTLVISVAASVTTTEIERELGCPCPIIRVMPNTPCLVGEGMSAMAAGRHAAPSHMALAGALFGACGRTAELQETQMDAVTGLSGSGPAYIYLVIESLAEAGVKVGISREISTLLSAQTVLGAARMVLDLKAHPALLKDAVTTPAGCTADGLLELEEGKLRVTLIKAVVKAAQRASELSPKTND